MAEIYFKLNSLYLPGEDTTFIKSSFLTKFYENIQQIPSHITFKSNTGDEEKKKKTLEAFFFCRQDRMTVDVHVGKGPRGNIKVRRLFFCA